MKVSRHRRFASRAGVAAAVAIATLGTLVAPPAMAQSPVSSPPPRLANDCSVDVTAKLNRWIDSVPDGSTLSFAAGGCYRIEGTVLVKNRRGLTFEGNGATFRAFTDGTGFVDNLQIRNHFYLWGGADLVMRNLKIQGENGDSGYRREYAGQRGVRIAGVQRALLENLTVTDVRGDFVEVDPDYYQTWRWSSDITIRNSTFHHSGRQGFSITGGRRIWFQNNRIGGTGLSIFDIEPDSGTGQDAKGFPTYGGAADVHIVNNDVGRAGTLFFGNVVRNPDVVTKDIEISGNRLRGTPLNIWSVGHRDRHYKRFTITDNVSDTPYAGPRGGVELVFVDDAVISGNKVPFYFGSRAPEVAVRTWGSTGVSVTGNKFPGARKVVAIDGHRFGQPWAKDAGGSHTVCGNRFGEPLKLVVDQPCG